jgi:predicted transcriptional regulator
MSSPPRISETEWEIMRIIWDRSPRSAREIIKTLQVMRKLASKNRQDTHGKTREERGAGI